MAASGFRVFGTSRRPVSGGRNGVEMLALDVRDDESVRSCVEGVLDRTGRVDVLVNNAGSMHIGMAEETTEGEAKAVFATNFFGAVRVTNAILPTMRHRGQGRIINVGSLGAWIGEPGEAFYAGTKAALARYTEALRHEVWHLGISVSLVEPGAFTTDVLRAASVSVPAIADYDTVREAARRTLAKSLRHGGDPHTVAALVVAIAGARSPKGRYTAGRDGRWLPYLKTLMPQRMFDRLLRRGYSLPRHRP